MMLSNTITIALALAAITIAPAAATTPPASADTVLINANIYTADAQRTRAHAMALQGGKIISIGANEDALSHKGPHTNIIDLAGKMILPGLHDTHIHAISAMASDDCDLESRAMNLADLSAFVQACITQYSIPEGEIVPVLSWNFSMGNQPDDKLTSLRVALDAASSTHQIVLYGNDGHHLGANSFALAQARNRAGEKVGISSNTLARDFKDIRHYFGTGPDGEPDGRLAESYAMEALGLKSMVFEGIDKKLAHAEDILNVTLPHGITSFMDAAVQEDMLPLYLKLAENKNIPSRITLAQMFDPTDYLDQDGSLDTATIMKKATALRQKMQSHPRIKADFIKIFADGVLEGDPFASPPTLPNGAVKSPYLQPRFEKDTARDWVKITGYVDTESEACHEARKQLAAPPSNDVIVNLTRTLGHHPNQCLISTGTLQNDAQVIQDYVAASDKNGFHLMIHAIGDRAIENALNALEHAQNNNPDSDKGHIVTHLQLVAPEDMARFSKLKAYASFTFAWAIAEFYYDSTVFPFFEQLETLDDMWNVKGYYLSNAYPAASIRKAGGTLIAGSDAPVETRDPRPFINIATAMTRMGPEGHVLNKDEAISIEEAIDAYTINGAMALRQADKAGSLEVGKEADFIIIDRDIINLAHQGQAHAIGETQVLETWFAGMKVYAAPSQ